MKQAVTRYTSDSEAGRRLVRQMPFVDSHSARYLRHGSGTVHKTLSTRCVRRKRRVLPQIQTEIGCHAENCTEPPYCIKRKKSGGAETEGEPLGNSRLCAKLAMSSPHGGHNGNQRFLGRQQEVMNVLGPDDATPDTVLHVLVGPRCSYHSLSLISCCPYSVYSVCAGDV
ncbi:hypothetical protein BaRGS_00023520 [Batillaria attramentaria]|uniref:Uncharacterized protein n=1 Tax=Batillaria attramentaria TaxID=370345 RepID=A0ABD0KDN8_9CAEN